MKSIYKYKIEISEKPTVIELPKKFRILSLQMQWDDLCFWAEVDTESETVKQQFVVVGTGWDLERFLDGDYRYIDSVQQDVYVWHVYYKTFPGF